MPTLSSVVVGGGIAGLLAAWRLADRGHHVTLVEREPEIGGLLRSFDYGKWGRFDYGAHNVGETGVPGLDALMFGLLPAEDWQVLEGNRRDLAGTFFNGSLGKGSVYPDLLGLPRPFYRECVAGFFQNLNTAEQRFDVDAESYLVGRFGEPIGRRVLGPVVRKLFGRPPEELDIFATMLTSLQRVILFDGPMTEALYDSSLLRERLGFPDQRRLPGHLASGRKVLYPRRYGMHRIVDAFRRRLEERGVELRCGVSVRGTREEKGRIESVLYVDASGQHDLPVTGEFVWTTGWMPLASLLNLTFAVEELDQPLRTVIVNLLIDCPPQCGDLYYFYCYEPGFITFRVTNFSAFCDGAPRAGGYPLSLELLLDPGVAFDPGTIVARAIDELARMGVLAKGSRVIFGQAEALKAGFPMPSRKNLRAIECRRGAVEARGLSNLRTVGILSEPGLFFQKDVLRHVYETVGREPK